MDVGPEWAEAVGLRLKEGRLFDPLRVEADRRGSIIVNEQFVKDFGMNNPINQILILNDTTELNIIGVVEDYMVSAVWRSVEPAILRLARTENYYNLVVRTHPENMAEVKEFLKEKWQELFPSYVFQGMFQEETMEEEKYINESILKINMFLAIVATILSLIGIYSLVSLSVLHRTKEIGIRNAVGAPLLSLIALLNRKFIIILLIASIIGCAGGYYLSAMLLDSIWDYFTDITAFMLLTAVLIMFVITLITISVKTYSAATQNPVTALQSE
jgi:ABC-type antimicrobial peptide transport system permease subunit